MRLSVVQKLLLLNIDYCFSVLRSLPAGEFSVSVSDTDTTLCVTGNTCSCCDDVVSWKKERRIKPV